MDEQMNNSGPRFIEVYGTYEPHIVGDATKGDEMDIFYIDWRDVLGLSVTTDGWILLIVRELNVDFDGNWLNEYKTTLSTLWIKENIDHFARRVNEGWSITEL